MKPRRLSAIAAAVGGTLIGDDREVFSVTVDSRTARPGALFVAVRGENGDGHVFVDDAFAHHAAAALVSPTDHSEELSGPVVVVEDTQEALLALAADERRALRATVLGITGSTGKTCTKDLAAAVLSVRFDTAASPASFNNEIGLPLTILSATERTEALVCEMGSRGIGHIARLCGVARPRIGIVTNVGVAHMEFFGSREEIARAKGELVEALPPDGVAVLNADDPVVREYRDRTPAGTVTFGASPDADVRAEDVKLEADGRATFALVSGSAREVVELAVPGEHMVLNALAAAACGITLGLAPGECASALKAAQVSGWRMETFTTPDGIRVVNDAYNANPASMAAALRAARWMSRGGRCIAVLGHMAELGEISVEEHERVGELTARLGIDMLVTVGPEARTLAQVAAREGMERGSARSLDDPWEALEFVRANARPGDLVLFKGSRVAGLEKLAEAMRGQSS